MSACAHSKEPFSSLLLLVVIPSGPESQQPNKRLLSHFKQTLLFISIHCFHSFIVFLMLSFLMMSFVVTTAESHPRFPVVLLLYTFIYIYIVYIYVCVWVFILFYHILFVFTPALENVYKLVGMLGHIGSWWEKVLKAACWLTRNSFITFGPLGLFQKFPMISLLYYCSIAGC